MFTWHMEGGKADQFPRTFTSCHRLLLSVRYREMHTRSPTNVNVKTVKYQINDTVNDYTSLY